MVETKRKELVQFVIINRRIKMSIKTQKQLAVLMHQHAVLQKEHKLCEELIRNLKKDKEALEAKVKELERKQTSKSSSRKTSRKKENKEG